MVEVPHRFVRVDAAAARFGPRVRRLGPLLLARDEPADEAVASLASLPRPVRAALIERVLTHGAGAAPDAPAPLRELVDAAAYLPVWVDLERVSRGGDAFVRTGIVGGFVLAFESLLLGYCSPAGNKPLVFSGRLVETTPRRLAETARFVAAVSARGGMAPYADGFRTAMQVRLLHAEVRRALDASPRWDSALWGAPVNQVDMAGTALLFSLLVLDGVRKLGLSPTREESEDLLHAWRWTARVLGVRDELLVGSEREAWELWGMIEATQEGPDDDARSLARALIESPRASARTAEERRRAERLVHFGHGLARHLLGGERADALGLPRNAWSFSLPAVRRVVGAADRVARRMPRGADAALRAGDRYWHEVVAKGLAGVPARFGLDEAWSIGGAR